MVTGFTTREDFEAALDAGRKAGLEEPGTQKVTANFNGEAAKSSQAAGPTEVTVKTSVPITRGDFEAALRAGRNAKPSGF